VFPARFIFPHEKKKSKIFFQPEKYAGSGRSRIFFIKIRNRSKIHAGIGKILPIVHPDTG